jgi:hypothetical protein
MKPFQIREFRAPAWVKAFLIGSCLLTAFLARATYVEKGVDWVFVFLCAFSAFAAVAVLDAFSSYIRVSQESIEIRTNFRRQVYDRASFDKVTWSWGGPVSLRRLDGTWMDLPGSLTGNSQSTTNTLRAWLRRDSDQAAVEA